VPPPPHLPQLAPGSSLSATVRLQEVDNLRPPSAASPTPSSRASGFVAPAPQLPTLSPAAVADEPGARPRLLVPEEDASGCNVVELHELVLRGAPPAYKAAAAAAQGRLSLTAGARLAGMPPRLAAAVRGRPPWPPPDTADP
jgi:hypothetical protein